MKKTINLLLIVFLTLISIQCRVENLEPSSLKKYNEKSRLDYLKIDRPITYKSNAYFVDVSKQGKIEFLNKKEIYIEGNAVVTALNKNVKLRRDVVIPNNSIVYVKVDSLDKTVTLELTNGSKFNVGFKYDYYLSDPEKGIKDSKFAYKAVFELNPSFNYAVRDLIDSTELKAKGFNLYADVISELKVTYSQEVIQEVIDGNIISGTKIENLELIGNIGFNGRGKYSINKNNETFIRKILLTHDFGTLIIPGTPIAITPNLEFGVAFKGEAEIDIGYKVFEGRYINSITYDFINDSWVKRTDSQESATAKWFKDAKGSISGEVKLGFFLTLSTHINKYKFLDEQNYVSAGVFSLHTFPYIKVETKLGTYGECLGNIKASFGVDFSYDYAVGVLSIDGERSMLFYNKLKKLDNASIVLKEISSKDFICGNPILIPSITTDFVKNLIKSHKDLQQFPLYDGNTPPSFFEINNSSVATSTWSSNEFLLYKSSYSVEQKFNVLKKDKIDLLSFKFSTQNNKLKIESTSLGNTARTERYNIDASIDPIITGTGNNFTIIGKCVGTIFGADNTIGNITPKYVNYYVLSGKKNGDKLEDLHYFIFVDAVKDCPAGQCLPVGEFRYYTAESAVLKP